MIREMWSTFKSRDSYVSTPIERPLRPHIEHGGGAPYIDRLYNDSGGDKSTDLI